LALVLVLVLAEVSELVVLELVVFALLVLVLILFD
jgi:hypothetical protein